MTWVRSAVLTLLLLGNLLPIPGAALIAALITVPLLGWEVLRALTVGKLHPVAWFVTPLFAVLAFAGYRRPLYLDYSHTVLHNFVTITLLSALAAALLRDRRDLTVFARVWVSVGVILAAGALAGGTVNGRAGGLDEANPIWLARALAVAIVAVAWLYWTRRLGARWSAAIALELFAGLFATGSRGPLAAMVVGLLAVAATQSGHQAKRLLALLAVIFAAVLASAAGLFGSSRITSFVTDATGSIKGSGRSSYWGETLTLIRQHPGGVGIGNWGYFTGNAPLVLWPHDLTLEIFAESGVIVGAVFLLVVLTVFVRLGRRRREPTVGLVLGMLACETVSVSVSGDLNARTFFMLLTLGWLVSRRSQQSTGDAAAMKSVDPVGATIISHVR